MVEEIPYDQLIDETCPSCRQTIPPGTTKCPHCGYQVREEPKPVTRVDRTPPKVRELEKASNRTWFGGVLILISGILGVVTGIIMMYDPDTMVNLYSGFGVNLSTDTMVLLGAVALIFGLVAIVGGIMALRRKAWPVAMAGGILGTLAMGALFLGSILGIIGLATIAVSRRDFRS